MKVSTLNLLRWLLVLLSPVIFISLAIVIDNASTNEVLNIIGTWVLGTLLILSLIIVVVLFIYKRSTIKSSLKRFLVYLVPISFFLVLIFEYTFNDFDSSDYFSGYSQINLTLSLILSIINYIEKIESILIGLILVIIIGFILNTLGFTIEGQLIIFFSFFLSSVGFIYLSIRSLKLLKENRAKGSIFVFYYLIIGVLNVFFLIIFSSDRPDLQSIYDKTGVIIFLLACLTLFIALPFSDFIEWSRQQKASFKRLIILPFMLFLIVFSLRFLLPETTYRKIFSQDSPGTEIVHFGMQDYKVDFINK
jgi:hypothetical protein